MGIYITLPGYTRDTKNDLENEIASMVEEWAKKENWRVKIIIK